jgi:GNAT superfamily N-acetyltransferase
VSIEIIQESIELLAEYEKVPIAFWVRSRFLVDPGKSGPTLIEESVEPYFKDYDAHERPSQWPERFDTSSWGLFSAFDGANRIGGATAAWKSPDLEMLEGRDDLVCLWDLRVHPDHRNRGVGYRLFESVVAWARDRQCSELKVETQNINIDACRFYARQGCDLRGINKDAYPPELNEIQLLWYRDLRVS